MGLEATDTFFDQRERKGQRGNAFQEKQKNREKKLWGPRAAILGKNVGKSTKPS